MEAIEAIIQEHVRQGNMETVVEGGEMKYRLTAQGHARADELVDRLPDDIPGLRGAVDGQHRTGVWLMSRQRATHHGTAQSVVTCDCQDCGKSWTLGTLKTQ